MNRTTRELTIDRASGESFLIGDAIEVLVESTKNGRVRLRCWAPGSVTVAPRELVDAVARENGNAILTRVPSMEDLCAALEDGEGRTP